ncbi:MAG: DUF2294 domain-containing protein [Phycisphaerae bacterium]
MKTKGQIEAEISEAIIKFEREYMGRGPDETRSYLLGDMVLVRLGGVLTPAEKQLAASGDYAEGGRLVKQVRMQLLEKARTLLEAIVRDITGRVVLSLHTDISTKTGERIIVWTLDGTVDCRPGDSRPQ